MAPSSNATSASVRQPQMPTLSPAASKALNRGGTPLTPKIASAKAPFQGVTLATPLARRTQRPESAASGAPGSGAGPQRDPVVSPVAAFLNNNVTPRSGSRQTRVESASSTPTGTPVAERTDTWETRTGLGISGLDAAGTSSKSRGVTFNPADPSNKPDPNARFFYANEAKTGPAAAAQPKPPTVLQSKNSAFFYANGETILQTSSPPSASPSTISSVLGGSQDSFSGKFVYANGNSAEAQAARAAPLQGPSSVVSTAPRLATGRVAASSPHASVQRPASPIKSPSQGSSKSTPGLQPALARQSGPGTTSPPLPASTAPFRRTSIDTPPRSKSRSRSGSLILTEPAAVARIGIVPPPAQGLSQPLSEVLASASHAAASSILPSSIAQSVKNLGTLQLSPPIDDPTHMDSALDAPQSPTKSQADAQSSDLVATARRERKVQDLEITNASLEAINRTLERQLRKQTAELRRFRRLSRHGRISLASSAAATGDREGDGGAEGGSRIVSGSSAGGGALARAGMNLEDLSEDDEEAEEEEDSADEDESALDDESDSEADSGFGSRSAGLSPREAVLRSARRRRRDERRLQLDLSKHQQLLVDSQKMNQSLRRCLGWTEELIKEGRRALDFQVRVSEVEIGGRVLPPTEDDDADGEGDDDDDAAEGHGGYVFEGGGTRMGDIEGDSGSNAGRDSGGHGKEHRKPDRDSAVELHSADGD